MELLWERPAGLEILQAAAWPVPVLRPLPLWFSSLSSVSILIAWLISPRLFPVVHVGPVGSIAWRAVPPHPDQLLGDLWQIVRLPGVVIPQKNQGGLKALSGSATRSKTVELVQEVPHPVAPTTLRPMPRAFHSQS